MHLNPGSWLAGYFDKFTEIKSVYSVWRNKHFVTTHTQYIVMSISTCITIEIHTHKAPYATKVFLATISRVVKVFKIILHGNIWTPEPNITNRRQNCKHWNISSEQRPIFKIMDVCRDFTHQPIRRLILRFCEVSKLRNWVLQRLNTLGNRYSPQRSWSNEKVTSTINWPIRNYSQNRNSV